MKRFLIIFFIAFLSLPACENVEDGYRADYPASQSNFSVTLLTPNRAVIGDSITFLINAEGNSEIKSILVSTSVSGGDGSGFAVPENYPDPLIDHVYGTIQPGIKSIELNYNYVIAQDTLDVTILFTLIDGEGKIEKTVEIYTIPSTIRYDSIILFSKNNSLADGFSTAEGTIYRDLTNYVSVSTYNQAIQESIDIIFLMDGAAAYLAAPYSGYFINEMSVKNKTLFKLIDNSQAINFYNLTSADVSQITEDNLVKKGTTQITNLKVGDIIGFRTDFASKNPYRYGLLHINSMHPTNIEHYQGTSYMIEVDIITQK